MEAQQEVLRQSRVGKRPVMLPQGVKLTIDGTKVSVTGPKGTIARTLPTMVEVKQEGSSVTVVAKKEAGADAPRFQGLAQALVKNMVHGVSEGFQASMDLIGVGYKAELAGQKLSMSLGLSHGVQMLLPDLVKGKVEIIDEGGQKKPRLILNSIDKELLGQTAAKIKAFRPPEPYKGKGVRFTGEKIREKAGKAAAKGK